jgi:glutathione S-transferase
MMKVYFAPASRAVRTVWLLNEMGLEHELVRFALGDKSMRAPEHLAVNPNGRVPTLVDGAGADRVTISESTAIAQYLVARHGPHLAPETASPDFPTYLQWLHYAEGMIMPPVNNYVVETILLPPNRRNPEIAARSMKLLARTLAGVEAHMSDGREYLVGGFTAADTITGHATIMSENFGVDMGPLPNLAAYNARLQTRPALTKALAL